MAFTPGPWSVGYGRKRGDAMWSWWEVPIHVGAPGVNGGPGNVLAIVVMGGPGATNSTQESVEANAKLIMTAPDLLAACETAIDAYDNAAVTGKSYWSGKDVDAMRAAIAKAKGTNP